MKALLINNQCRAMSIFWRILMEKMRDKDMNVTVCVPDNDPEAEKVITATGSRVIHYPLDRKGLNPIKDLRSFRSLKSVMRQEKPDIVFTSTIKPVIYGCIAAKAENVPGIFAAITGLGYVFEKDKPSKKLIHWLGSGMYKFALRNINGIFFQNKDDARLFETDKIISPRQKIFFTPGTGVDIARFAPAPFPDDDIVFLLIGRLLLAKGLKDYAEAARMLHVKWPRARFQVLGIPETGPGSLPLELINTWHTEGVIEYLGQTRDVRPIIAESHVAVLPSWREGVPTSIMEAMSMGRPCVVTDAPGCREVVENGVNGWLCEAGNPASLAKAMEKFLLNPASIPEMGAKSRKMADDKFDGHKVAEKIISDMLGNMPDRKGGAK